MKKATAQDIIDNINARIHYERICKRDPVQLQNLLDAIVRHNSGIESIETSTSWLNDDIKLIKESGHV